MLDFLKIKINQGKQFIPNIRKAKIHSMFRGLPVIEKNKCMNNCEKCIAICPSGAINIPPLTIDLGKCVFCGDCERVCPVNAIKYTNFHKISADRKEKLIITEETGEDNYYKNAIAVKKEIKNIFGRSFKIREVSAGGCNGCEMELNACSNVNFDMGRFGIEFVASPRHADCILITGPITENMALALEDAYLCTPTPRLIILAGACAISGGVFSESKALNREFINKYKIDLYIPGCPVHPLTVINGILDLVGRK